MAATSLSSRAAKLPRCPERRDELQRLPDRRLRDVQALGSGGDTAGFDHDPQQFQGSNTEAHNLLLMQTFLFII
jgi:hypothetical protein